MIPAGTETRQLRNKVFDFAVKYWIPVGLFGIYTGLFWLPDRDGYQQILYWLVLLPAILCAVSKPISLKYFFEPTATRIFVIFASYAVVSLAWSGTTNELLSLIKRPLYIGAFLYAAFLVFNHSEKTLSNVVLLSLATATLSAIVVFMVEGLPRESHRHTGLLTFHNPILTMHVYGFFAVLALAYWVNAPKRVGILALFSGLILCTLVAASQSRGPLVAVFASMVWMLVLSSRDKSRLKVALLLSCTALLTFAFMPDSWLSRGSSYRIELWAGLLHKMPGQWFLGHGLDSRPSILVPAIGVPLDPHNALLMIVYQLGLIGLGIWLALHANILKASFDNPGQFWIYAGSATLVFGLVSSIFENPSYLARPKEHWFLTWVPLTLILGSLTRRD
jgi:hypothetical protein